MPFPGHSALLATTDASPCTACFCVVVFIDMHIVCVGVSVAFRLKPFSARSSRSAKLRLRSTPLPPFQLLDFPPGRAMMQLSGTLKLSKLLLCACSVAVALGDNLRSPAQQVQTLQALIEEKHKRLRDAAFQMSQLKNDLSSTRVGLASDTALKQDGSNLAALCMPSLTMDAAIKIINDTENKAAKLQRDLDRASSAIGAGCRADETSFLSSFDGKVTDHKRCKEKEVSAGKVHESCMDLQRSQETLKTSTCSSGILSANPTEMGKELCKTGSGVKVGPWLQSTRDTFKVKSDEWNNAQNACTRATNDVKSTTARCVQDGLALSSAATRCDTDLTSLEKFACSYATEHALACRGYDTCYNAALDKYKAEIAKVPGLIKTWQDNVGEAEQMKCYANACTPSGGIDPARLTLCRNASLLVDTSKISVTIAVAPARQSCDDPRMYPGSSSYWTKLNSSLPAGIKIREPTLCLGWKSGCAARSTFDQWDVFLKYNGQYCNVQTGGRVVCNGGKGGTFRFQQENTKVRGGQGQACYAAIRTSMPLRSSRRTSQNFLRCAHSGRHSS